MNMIIAVGKWFLIITGLLFWCVFLVILGNSLASDEKIYNCSLAEISPDYPREVVNECRKMRNNRKIST